MTTLVETAERARTAALSAQQDVAAIVDVDLNHLVTEQVKKIPFCHPWPPVRSSRSLQTLLGWNRAFS